MGGCQDCQKSEFAPNANQLTGTEKENPRTIPLTKEKWALVDEEDYEWLSKYKWQAFKHRETFYARRNHQNK